MVDKPLTNCSNVLTSKYQKVIYYSKLRLFLLKNKTKTLVIELTLLIKKLGAQIKKLFLNKSFALGFGLTYILLLVTTRRAVCAVVYKTLTDIEKEQTKRRTWKEYFKSLKSLNYLKKVKSFFKRIDFEALIIGLTVALLTDYICKNEIFPYLFPGPKINILQRHKDLGLPPLPRLKIMDLEKWKDDFRQENNFPDQNMTIQKLNYLLYSVYSQYLIIKDKDKK